ncbi:MAG: class I mannose-6-phosphate isomerase [Bacteroidales bacterium]|nr:class I mannose-6-phosphate isomerase [Bacteroidales bacterium]
MKLYPFLFQPDLHPLVWGGYRLFGFKGMPSQQRPIGESWEVSVIPYSTSIISNGPFRGRNLADVVQQHQAEILGPDVAEKHQGQLPLLVKFIDARSNLSIQVHPNNAMARAKYDKPGKSEMWYVIDAEPGSFIYAGFSRPITEGEYYRRVADSTICDVLARHEVRPGDVFYLPAGRIHAIGRGILLAEIQQSSDITYRIFDYNRPGMDGLPRELHTVLAAKALDFGVEADYKTTYQHTPDAECRLLDSPHFSASLLECTRPMRRNLIPRGSFVISMCISGSCKIRIRSTGYEIDLSRGHSTLIPASITDYDIIPIGGNVLLLDSFVLT